MKNKDKKFPDSFKIFLFRWWTVGACCFLGAFGTFFGAQSTPIDLLFLLAAMISAVTIFLFNPIMSLLYDIKRGGRIVNKEYKKQSLSSKIFRHIREIIKCYFISILVFFLYQGVNSLLVMAQNYDENAFIISVEPILYGLIFALFYDLLSNITDKVVVIIRNKKGKNNE